MGQLVADVPSGLGLTPSQEIKKNWYKPMEVCGDGITQYGESDKCREKTLQHSGNEPFEVRTL
jgi:hypothetical protein